VKLLIMQFSPIFRHFIPPRSKYSPQQNVCSSFVLTGMLRPKPASQSVDRHLGLLGYWHCGHSWPIVPASGDSEDDCGEADGM
jgi:hypothetical protein